MLSNVAQQLEFELPGNYDMPNNCYKPIWHTFVGLLFLFLVRFYINSVFTTWWRCSCTSCCTKPAGRDLHEASLILLCAQQLAYHVFVLGDKVFSIEPGFLLVSYNFNYIILYVYTSFMKMKVVIVHFCFIVSRRYGFRVSTGS